MSHRRIDAKQRLSTAPAGWFYMWGLTAALATSAVAGGTLFLEALGLRASQTTVIITAVS